MSGEAQLLPLSANTVAALDARVGSYMRAFADRDAGQALADVCYTAGARRDHHRHRTAVVGCSRDELLERLSMLAPESEAVRGDHMTASLEQPTLAFVLPGIAALEGEMTLELLCSEIAFLEAFERCEEALRAGGGVPLMTVLLNGSEQPALSDVQQEWATFTIELSLGELWRSWGIEPHAIVGTGVGEHAAAVLRGERSPEEALAAISVGNPRNGSAYDPPLSPSNLRNDGSTYDPPLSVHDRDETVEQAGLSADDCDVVLEIRLPPVPPVVNGSETRDRRWQPHDALDGRARTRLLQTLAQLYEAGLEPRWEALHGAGAQCVPLPRHEWQHETHLILNTSDAQPPPGDTQRAASPLPEQPVHDPASSRQDLFVRLAANVLRLPPARMLPDRTLPQHGLDSLMAIELKATTERETGVELSFERIAGDATLAELAAEVTAEVAQSGVDNNLAEARHPSSSNLAVRVLPDIEGRFEPFRLSEIQRAYWVGRSGGLELGGVSTHFYVEVDGAGLDVDRLSWALSRLVERHDMLCAVVDTDGSQRVLESVGDYEVSVLDLRALAEDDAALELERVRARMSHQVLPADRWPLFEVKVSRLTGRDRLHLSFDMLVADAASLFLLGEELAGLYQDPELKLPKLELRFRDYVLVEQALEGSPEMESAWEYWRARLADLPAAPELPLACSPSELGTPRFRRLTGELGAHAWERLKGYATEHGLTPSTLVCAAYAEVLAHWSRNPRFTLNLTNYRRLPLHEQVHQVVGDFTSLTLLEVDVSSGKTFLERARGLQEQLWKDLEHRTVNGVSVLRELARERGIGAASMPVVFTSVLNHTVADRRFPLDAFGKQVFAISQTPQVWLDNQVIEVNGALQLSWDVVDGLFPPAQAENMFDAYTRLLSRLSNQSHTWTERKPIGTPSHQLRRRQAVNATEVQLPLTGLLHEPFRERAREEPERAAVIAGPRTLSYGELQRRASAIARELHDFGARPNKLVAVAMEKGWEQVVGALAVLESGAAYLPLDPELPCQRLHYLLEHAEVELVLTQSWVEQRVQWPQGVKRIAVDIHEPEEQASDKPQAQRPPPSRPSDLAYVIFTSGSTGQPKGVMIEHAAALNTILDINRRFEVGVEDRVLALSSLSFDLSVYDLFGALAAGAAIVLPDPKQMRDPAHWNELLAGGVSIWNSVPALMKLLVEHVELRESHLADSLRLVMLSGDWIPVSLPDRLRALGGELEVVSLGGATEASIWSIYYPIGEVPEDWESIPYGRPLDNQAFHVLDAALEDRPDWVAGDLYIAGDGLARGYWKDERKTDSSFVVNSSGERLYRTGDLGRYLSSGDIEFLGREDGQVKVNGYRIELGEVEAALEAHSRVRAAVACAHGRAGESKRLIAYYVPAVGDASIAVGDAPIAVDDASIATDVPATTGDPNDILTAAELRMFLEQRLPSYMLPASILEIDRVPLTANGKVDRNALADPARKAPPRRADPTSGFAGMVCEQLDLERGDLDAHLLRRGISQPQVSAIADRIQRELTSRPDDERVWEEILALWLQAWLRQVLELNQTELDLTLPLSSYGLDSLVAIRLRDEIAVRFGSDIHLQALLGSASIGEVAVEAAVSVGSRAVDGNPESGVGVVPDTGGRFESFGLSEIQRAYWVGRMGGLELGGVSTHFYVEVDGTDLDMGRLSAAVSRLVERHDMLRAIVVDGYQRVLESVPDYVVSVLDLRALGEDESAQELERVRAHMSHQVLPADRWPLFEVKVSRLTVRDRLHLSFDMLVADAASLFLLGRELAGLYRDPETALPELELRFRDYVTAEQALESSSETDAAWSYWRARIAQLPAAPELPLACSPSELGTPRFRRLASELEVRAWARLKEYALQEGLTPSTLVCAAYAEVLAHWSGSPRFTLNLTNYRRLPLHEQVHQVVGDFTSLTLLEVNTSCDESFVERAHKLQEQLLKDLEHRAVNGVSVLRELARERGIGAASMPVVFTSVLNHTITDQAFPLETFGKQVFAISQTPQVWLDNQVMEVEGALRLSWDVVEGLFPAGQAESMFDAYTRLLMRLSSQPRTWTEYKPIEHLDEDRDRVEVHEYRSVPLQTTQHSVLGGRRSGGENGDDGERTLKDLPRDYELERRITGVICEQLELSGLDPDAHLLEQGVSSMQIVMLADHLERELGRRPQIEMLFALPTAGTLVSELGKTLRRESANSTGPEGRA